MMQLLCSVHSTLSLVARDGNGRDLLDRALDRYYQFQILLLLYDQMTLHSRFQPSNLCEVEGWSRSAQRWGSFDVNGADYLQS